MASPAKINLKVVQGSTVEEVLRWESPVQGYKSITGVTKAAPAVITAVGHGLPVGWRVKITNVVGMKEINSEDTYHIVSDSTSDSVTINSLNTLGYTNYTSGGVLNFNVPEDLNGYTARMQIRQKLTSTDIIKELTTENGGITLDNTAKTITINISATDTAAFTFSTAVYSLEMVKSGDVQCLVTGTITLDKEITR